MKKIIAPLVALALFTGLTACSGTPEPTPTVTETQTVTPTPTPTPMSKAKGNSTAMTDSQFVDYVREEKPYLNRVPAKTIVELADTACRAFDRGTTLEEIAKVLLDHSTSTTETTAMAFVIGAGVRNYCPEHTAVYDESPKV